MDTRRAALCFLLVLVMLHEHPTSVAGGEEECKYNVAWVPWCKGWSCKVECMTEAALLLLARVKEHKCIKGGFKGRCYCLLCGKHLPGSSTRT